MTASENIPERPAEESQDATRLAEELEVVKKEAEGHLNKLLYLRADFENFKKRNQKEREVLIKFANEALFRELLPIVDNLERAVKYTDADKAQNSGLLEGIQLMHAQILKIFSKFGVEPLTSMGEVFDPHFHEALGQEEREDVEENIIIEECQKGYKYHDKVLRPSHVIVAKKRDKSGPCEREEGSCQKS